jgi:hypothetical protein
METATEFTTQDYAIWSNVSKLSLITLRDIDVRKVPKLSGLGNLRRLFSSFVRTNVIFGLKNLIRVNSHEVVE